MTLDEAFALVRENGLTWHGLYEDRGEFHVRLRTTSTYSGIAAYGFGQHVDLPEAVRQAILGCKDWERWRPSNVLPSPAFGAKPGAKPQSPKADVLAELGITEAELNAALNIIKESK